MCPFDYLARLPGSKTFLPILSTAQIKLVRKQTPTENKCGDMD